MAMLFVARKVIYRELYKNIKPGQDDRTFEKFYRNFFPKQVFQAIRKGLISEWQCHQREDFPLTNLRLLIDNYDYFLLLKYVTKIPQKILFPADITPILKQFVPVNVTERQLKTIESLYHRFREEGYDKYDYYRERLINFYSAIDFSSGNFLSIPPLLIDEEDGKGFFGKKIVELFGSPFNLSHSNYCALTDLEQKQFGSFGPFYNFQPEKYLGLTDFSLIIINPPFDPEVCNDAYKLSTGWIQNMEKLVVIYFYPEAVASILERHNNSLDYQLANDYFEHDIDNPPPDMSTPRIKKIYRSSTSIERDQGLFYMFQDETYHSVTDVRIIVRSQLDLEHYCLVADNLKNRWKDIVGNIADSQICRRKENGGVKRVRL